MATPPMSDDPGHIPPTTTGWSPARRLQCLEWEETTRSATPWQRIRHAIAVFINADEFYEGNGYECDAGVEDVFHSTWTERRCIRWSEGDDTPLRLANDWLPKLQNYDPVLAKLLQKPEQSGVLGWDWGKLEVVEPHDSSPPAAGQQPPPSVSTPEEPD
jgi:hypothetical protein